MTDPREAGWSWLMGKLYGLIQRNPASNRTVAALAELTGDDMVLDVGCGAGGALKAASRTVPENQLSGADPTPALVTTARKRLPEADIEVAVAEDLPFDDRSFSVVWTISSFHHWTHPRQGLEELLRVLAPGGRLLLAEHRNKKDGGHGLSDREANQLIATLGEIGFEDVHSSQHGSGRKLTVVTGRRSPA